MAGFEKISNFTLNGLFPPLKITPQDHEGGGLVQLWQVKDGKMVTLRIPYPLGFYAKGFDGRIDDPNAGWKGRGLWATVSTRAPFHMEGGKGTPSKVLHFQVRTDPLAK